MLVLTAQNGQVVTVGEDGENLIEIMVVSTRDGKVRLAFNAPLEINIRRRGRDYQLSDRKTARDGAQA